MGKAYILEINHRRPTVCIYILVVYFVNSEIIIY